MVKIVTSWGRSGLSDWLVQRVTAFVLLVYTVLMFVVIVGIQPDYAKWSALFSQMWMRIFSFAALLSLALHAWIGLWSISTDYLTVRLMGAKGTWLRLLFQAACAVVLFVYVIWGFHILWR